VAITIDFSGQVALITGGTKGVGKGIAQRFADAGAQVVVCARSIPDDLPKTGRPIQSTYAMPTKQPH